MHCLAPAATAALSMRTSFLAGASALTVALHVQLLCAQPPEHHGLTGGLYIGSGQWKLDDRSPPAHATGGLMLGYRVKLFEVGGKTVSIMPHAGLLMTRLRGIDLGSNQLGFARVDKPGMQLAVRFHKFRVYGVAQKGSVSVERMVGNQVVNYWGSAPAYGIGVEIPRNNPCGAGLDISYRSMRGDLTDSEWRGSGSPPPGGHVRGNLLLVGWSGRFRGTRLLFSCR